MERPTGAPYFFVTVDVEEWFTSTKILSPKKTKISSTPSDVFQTTRLLLDILNAEGMRGTFFFIKNIAERFPDLVREISATGHEIALHGENHAHLNTVENSDFESMLHRMKLFFQTRFNVTLAGYRAPYFSITSEKIGLLKSAGFLYDSSVVPCLPIPGWYGVPGAPLTPYPIGDGALSSIAPQGNFLEFPMSVHPTLRLPGLGGYYFRNLGFRWARHIVNQCLGRLGYAMLYIHPWELSPLISGIHGHPFYMRRRTGQWTQTALRALLRSVRADHAPMPIPLREFCNRKNTV